MLGTITFLSPEPTDHHVPDDRPADPVRQALAEAPREPGDGRGGFDIDAQRKHRLLKGLDLIGLTLAKADAIRAYEARRRVLEPWLFE